MSMYLELGNMKLKQNINGKTSLKLAALKSEKELEEEY
jgi:hypothetical protein